MIYNDVRDFGAVLDLAADDSSAVEQAVAAALANNLPVYVPGPARITRTIHLPLMTGLKIIGTGGHMFGNPNSPKQGAGSGLYWDGDDGGTMVQTQMSQLLWCDLPLYGKVWGSPKQGAGIKMLIAKDVEQGGIGTGKTSFANWYSEGPGTGVQLGFDRTTNNSDVLCFTGNSHFLDEGINLHVLNDMGMGIYFDQMFAQGTTIFKFEAGGDLVVNSLIVTNNATRVGLETGIHGRNNGHFRFGFVKKDAINTDFRMVKMPHRSHVEVSIGQLHWGEIRRLDYDPRMFELHGRCKLTIGEAREFKRGSIIAKDSPSGSVNISLARAVVPEHPRVIVRGRWVKLKTTACHDENFFPRPDYSSY